MDHTPHTESPRTTPAHPGSPDAEHTGQSRPPGVGERVMLVVGVTGLVGHATARRALSNGWRVVGLSRRDPSGLDGLDGLEHHAVDLTDEAACRSLAPTFTDVTHVVYAALHEEPGLFGGWLERDTIDRNVAMLRNVMGPVVDAADALEHVTLLHGTKAYGVHRPELGMRGLHLPLRERVPVRPHPNFYFEQAEELERLRAVRPFGVTVFRPTVIVGEAVGVNMNPMLPIAAYATILRHLGRPFAFPGRHPDHVRDVVDADLVGAAACWAVRDPRARGGTFNLTNGDVYTWSGLWPALADAFGLPLGDPEPAPLHEWLPEHADDWAAACERFGLRADRDVVAHVGANSLVYADLVLGSLGDPDVPPPLILHSTVAARRAGFAECVDTEDAFRASIERLRAVGMVP